MACPIRSDTSTPGQRGESVTSGTVDLNICDNEPIQLIGAVQPHGTLVALNEKNLIISYVSKNTLKFVGFTPEDILGKPLSFLVGE